MVYDSMAWDGSTGTQLHPVQAPPATGTDLNVDFDRQRLVMPLGADVWEWGGATWLRRTPASAPARWDHAAWDPIQHRTLAIDTAPGVNPAGLVVSGAGRATVGQK